MSRPAEPDLTAKLRNGAGAVLRRVDPGYDELDELDDDFLADVANIVNSFARREWMLKTKHPEEGPWHA